MRTGGIETAHVRVRDDIASAPPDRWKDRRGVAGDVFTIKIAGAACDQGLTLEQVRKAAEKPEIIRILSVWPPRREPFRAILVLRLS